MTSKPPPPPPPPPPSTQRPQSPRATIPPIVELSLSSGPVTGADRVVIYGTGKIGKTTLAAYLPAPLFLDLEMGTRKLNVARDVPVTWDELRGKLAGIAKSPPDGLRSIVIDSCTKGEELATEYLIQNKKAARSIGADVYVDSIEAYGWGKGFTYLYEQFCGLLADLDRIIDRGLNVCLIAHDVSRTVPNPSGEDFLRWEPLLHAGDKKGRADIRALVKNWAEHVVYVGYDVHVKQGEGKGVGSGTRTLYTYELPTHIAGSRTKQLDMAFDLQDPGALWRELGIS